MQPRMTIQALATVWLAVVGLGAAVTHRLSHDQYFPASPHRHSRVQRNQIRDWGDHDPAEDQPLDLWIGSRRSIPAEEPLALPHSSTKFTEQNFPLERSSKEDIVSSKRDYPFSAWQKWLLNIAGAEFEADKVDYGYEMPQTLSRETVILPSDLLDDPFVADDTFQDQGPGSVEIYKLDLSKENVLLTATTPTNDLLPKNKSKSPKKTSHLNSKTKTTEKLTTTPSTKTHHEQSNVFEEQRTETPSVNTNSFGVGGVPELQVGCEGLEASSSSSSSHKAKRSIDTPDKEQRQVPASILRDVTPIFLDMTYYDMTYDNDEEEEEEEMDELLKIKRLETKKKIKTNRGDMDASHLNSDHLSNQPDRLPVRGDLGESTLVHSNESRIEQKESLKKIEIKNQEEIKEKRMPISSDEVDGASKNRGRRLLWLAEANTEGFAYDKSEQKRAKRSIDWGFGEDEGVVSSNELQTMNARRRKHDMRYHQDAARKRDQYYEVNSDINKIRREYEEHLAQKRREEEEQRLQQQQQNDRRTPNLRWVEEEERRRDKMRTRQYDDYFRKMNRIPASRAEDDETRRRQMEERQRDEEERRRRLQEEMRRRSQSKWQEENVKKPNFRTPVYDEETIQRSNEEMRRREEEARRQEWYRKQQETQKRKDEEERKRQEENRQREEQRRELAERRRQEEEERRRQQPPSNLMDTRSQSRHPNDIERRDRDEERRMREDEERQREKKLREYIARNQPINVNHSDRRSEEERRRYRPEYNRDSQMNTNRNGEEYRRIEEQRRRHEEEQRRRQEEEQRRRQEGEQRRRQEEEQRRRQEEEQRRRQEGEQRRRQEGEQRRRQEEEQRRRQEEEEKKLQDYIKRNQPINVRNNQSTSRNLLEERRLIEQARRRDRYSDPEAGRHRGPSVSTHIDPRSSPEEIWRRQQETARRQEEERRREREREEKERRLREEQMRKEAARREQEARREQSRRYEEERKRLEATRLREERRRQEMLRERSRSEAERTRQPEAARPTYYQDPRLMEHRRRQDSHPIPSNLVRNEQERRKERERQRLEQEAERRRQQENRWLEHGRNESEYGRSRQELARLNSLPISAKIIVRPNTPGSPTVLSRAGDNDIDFTGINPHREGVQVAKFPVAPTSRPPVPSPKPCVWAVVHCCSSNNSRLSKCFESLGCPGINWDPNPCSSSIVEAARAEVMKFYESQ